MKILITGGLGFIGSNLCRHMITRHPEFEVTNIDKIGIGANPANLKDLKKSDGKQCKSYLHVSDLVSAREM
jgi:dTDP-glucose 4,6-dehydratase